MSINIRRAEINDSINLSELNKKCLPIYYTPIECMLVTLSLQYIVLVAEENNKLIGYIIGQINPKEENYHIMSIGIDLDYRNKGIGTMLINNVIELLKSQLNNITLYVHTENINAVKFYEKNGFTTIETLINYYEGNLKSKSQDAYKMRKIIL
ncbi:acetyltransferase GNAT [Fadolivirus algeromassiliense]|jgi:ribosomal protein S18 acetylase RimI-like enzyme|uniref:Acetyltransferase GNAT n=1 Tax=Fadolivirus FV1/VV64 TaxID=3070911 RepID=A0A7D3QUZ8_9VIRU|nr:acetyltransferase GNAT [Fadolivirus algeromassiliense]QKF94607.1 acetyltransferase GNAT [Fadolivirus FV1/VV64]